MSVALILLLLAAGCAVGPNYKRPKLDVPDSYRLGPVPASTNSIADLPWWDIFQDEDLRNLIRTAYTNNYDLRIGMTRVIQSRAQLMQARSAFFPQLNYEGWASRSKNANGGRPFSSANLIGNVALGTNGVSGTNATSGAPTTDLVFFDGNVSWELDIWGRIRRLSESARAQLLANEEARRAIMTTVLADVATAYFQLLALDEQLEIAHGATNSFGESFKIFTERLEAGVASNLEAARAEAAEASAAATVPDLERQIIAQENLICILIGENPHHIQRSRKLLEQMGSIPIPPGLPISLLERRPDIRQNEQLLRAANAQIGVAVADFLPHINLTGLLGTVSPDVAALTGGSAFAWSAAADLTGPLFHGGELIGRYRQVKAEWDQARLQYKYSVLTALEEVSDALVAREKYAQQAGHQDRSVRAYQLAVQVSMQRYIAGRAGYFELLEAQQQLFPAENTLVQARLNHLLAFVQLYRSLGGGWTEQVVAEEKAKAEEKSRHEKKTREKDTTQERSEQDH